MTEITIKSEIESHYQRRHSKWHEILLFNKVFQALFGAAFVSFVPAAIIWKDQFLHHASTVHYITLGAIVLSFLVSSFSIQKIETYSSGSLLTHTGAILTTTYLLTFAFLLLCRVDYSRSVLLLSFVASLLWSYAGYFIGKRYRNLKFAVLPLSAQFQVPEHVLLDYRHLQQPDLGQVRFDGVIAELGGPQMTAEWEKFLTRCSLDGIPVFHIRQISEQYTGRVTSLHLTENESGTLEPALLYSIIKRLIDIGGVLITLPITLPLMLFTAILIKVDSRGPVLFTQNRVGKGGRDFKIYKFRSMRIDAEKDGPKLASTNDSRITKAGHFIRKTRLDELPQLWNVLKGNMSLIGPRPEQRVFVNEFEEAIPFYSYRHVVRPGLTGWAQVKQGYTSNTDETSIKIQYDLYYIKHLSFWLDVLIVLKTLRILFTGRGAK